MTLMEICVDSIVSASNAIRGGADRLELCSALASGGVTPSAGLLRATKELFPGVVVFVMIRPREGDFVYSEMELRQMELEIDSFKSFGADGFVFGVLTPEGLVDAVACSRLISLCRPLPATFHRAIDLCADWRLCLTAARDCGFSRVLTSGGAASAAEGAEAIAEMVRTAKDWDGFEVMAGAGVGVDNVVELVERTGVKEVHASAKKRVEGRKRSGKPHPHSPQTRPPRPRPSSLQSQSHSLRRQRRRRRAESAEDDEDYEEDDDDEDDDEGGGEEEEEEREGVGEGDEEIHERMRRRERGSGRRG